MGTQDMQIVKVSLYFILSIRLVTNLIVKEYSKRKCDIINISNPTLAHCGLPIPYSQYIAALVVIDCWPGQHRAVTSSVGTMVGGEVTYDHYNYNDTEVTYDDDNNDDTEEGWTKGR